MCPAGGLGSDKFGKDGQVGGDEGRELMVELDQHGVHHIEGIEGEPLGERDTEQSLGHNPAVPDADAEAVSAVLIDHREHVADHAIVVACETGNVNLLGREDVNDQGDEPECDDAVTDHSADADDVITGAVADAFTALTSCSNFLFHFFSS